MMSLRGSGMRVLKGWTRFWQGGITDSCPVDLCV